jgi:hypothetical protein
VIDPSAWLAAVPKAAWVSIERSADFRLFNDQIGGIRFELTVAAFAFPQKPRTRFDDAECSIRHPASLLVAQTPALRWFC